MAGGASAAGAIPSSTIILKTKSAAGRPLNLSPHNRAETPEGKTTPAIETSSV